MDTIILNIGGEEIQEDVVTGFWDASYSNRHEYIMRRWPKAKDASNGRPGIYAIIHRFEPEADKVVEKRYTAGSNNTDYDPDFPVYDREDLFCWCYEQEDAELVAEALNMAASFAKEGEE